MVFVIDASGNPTKTSDNEQMNQSLTEKYPAETFVFEAVGYSFSDLEAIVKKVCKSLDVVFEPLYGYVLINSGKVSAKVYKRAITTLKNKLKELR